MNRIAKSTMVFAGMGLVGPLLWNAVPHPSRAEGFVSDLVFLLWPSGMIGAVESKTGEAIAAVLTIGANLVLFSLLGLVVGAIGKDRRRLMFAYGTVAAMIVAWAFWGAGLSLAHLGVLALLVALAAYALPFGLLMRGLSGADGKQLVQRTQER